MWITMIVLTCLRLPCYRLERWIYTYIHVRAASRQMSMRLPYYRHESLVQATRHQMRWGYLVTVLKNGYMLDWQSVNRSWKSLHTCYSSALKDPCERSPTSVLKSNEIKVVSSVRSLELTELNIKHKWQTKAQKGVLTSVTKRQSTTIILSGNR